MKFTICFLSIVLFIGLTVCTVTGHNKNITRVPEIKKAPKPPTIDGSLEEWSPKTSITGYQTPDSEETAPSGGNPAPEEEKDFSFELFAMWDENNIYFAGAVVDDIPELENNQNSPWNSEADWFEFYMDPLYEGGTSRHIGVTIGIINGTEAVAYQSDPTEGLSADFDVAFAKAEKLGPNNLPGWTFEVRLGKASFDASGINLTPEQKFGLLAIPGDQDGEERKRIAWPPFDAINADNYAGMIFSPALATAVEARDKLGITWALLKSPK